jgi:hypothetical protein
LVDLDGQLGGEQRLSFDVQDWLVAVGVARSDLQLEMCRI